MSEPFIAADIATPSPLINTGCLSGLRFMAPGTPAPHDGMVYRSRGAVLVIGDSAAAANAARQLLGRAPRLRIALFAPGAGALADLPSNITAVGGRIVSLQGHLGQFVAEVRVAVDKCEDAGIFSPNADRRFDLVLDLCRQPLLRQNVLPHGYYALGDDAAALSRALDSLSQLSGDFHKPKYFDYRPQLCAHGAMGVSGCTRCIEACDAAAIRSAGERIEVDPWLCQGCAGCALACPTGALSFQSPPASVLQEVLTDLLAAHAGDTEATFLVVHDAASRPMLPATAPSGVVLFEVNPLPAFSDVMWLTALAGGASGVVMLAAPAAAPRSRALIEQKLGELRAILASFGGDPAMQQIATRTNVGVLIDQIKSGTRALTATVKCNPSDEKRASFLALVDALAQSRPAGDQTREPCPLPAGAAFGEVRVDAGKCTICHACVHLCPTGALSGRLEPAPALQFTESLCVQCDLCRAGCPEKAITLRARFLPDAVARETTRELASDELVPCRGCGTPYIGQRKLAASLALMQQHASAMPGGLDSLRMCPACRQRETMAL